MAKFSNDFLGQTIRVWQPHYDCPLSIEDAQEIVESMTGLFHLLVTLDRKYSSEVTNGNQPLKGGINA